jgi:hypothetical protein
MRPMRVAQRRRVHDPCRAVGRLATLARPSRRPNFSIAGFVTLYGLLRLQGVLPFNPQGRSAVEQSLAFNTAVSFVTNTNWQAYGVTIRRRPRARHFWSAERLSRSGSAL